jgi:hypothetical protein
MAKRALGFSGGCETDDHFSSHARSIIVRDLTAMEPQSLSQLSGWPASETSAVLKTGA